MARRMNEATRTEWKDGTASQHAKHSRAVANGEYQCDHCEATAVAIGTGGTDVKVRCGACFLAWRDEDRKNRPTREQMIARVNAALA